MKYIALILGLSFTALAQVTAITPTPVSPTSGVAPGSLVTIWGHNLTRNNTTETATSHPWPIVLAGDVIYLVYFDKIFYCPILYASPDQINILLPSELGEYFGVMPSTLYINTYGEAPNPTHYIGRIPGEIAADINISALAPSLFAHEDKTAAALHPNYKAVSPSDPAEPGEIIALYATGIGYAIQNWNHLSSIGIFPCQMPPPGQFAPGVPYDCAVYGNWFVFTDQIHLTVDGLPAKITYAGPALGFDGLDQMNIQIPNKVRRKTSVTVAMYTCAPPPPWVLGSEQDYVYSPIGNTVLLAID
jgi:uncharacterized protein (TIGR03437 family)